MMGSMTLYAMKRLVFLAPLFGCLLAAPCALAQTGDGGFLAAREAFRNGETVRLARLLGDLEGHELRPWAEYYLLRLKLDEENSGSVREFLARMEGSYPAEKLRGDWLRFLGKRGEWAAFREEYPRLVQPDPEVTCYALRARIENQDRTALDEARPLWFSVIDLPESCLPLMERLMAEGRLGEDEVWARLRRLFEARKMTQAKAIFRYLPARQMPAAKSLEAIIDRPARYLAKLPENATASRTGRELVLFAVQRMARQDPAAAATLWRDLEAGFTDGERAYAWGQLAWQAATRHLPEALAWYESAGALSEEQVAWKVRAALRMHDWATVKRTIEQMPHEMAAQPDWIYWLGRSLTAHGRTEEAKSLFQRIAGQPSFYGNLADEELGRVIAVPARAAPATTEELMQAAENPGLRRALTFIRLDMRIDGVREWNWTIRNMTDRQLLAAAELARRHDLYDRAINTADRTRTEHDFGLRYLAPFRESVEPKARNLALDGGWVYGLMRQESRFIGAARSTVGAQGLMQVMPATAKWVAKKVGLSGYRPGRIADMDTNVTLGTHYMKMVLDSLDNHPVLASAAYNAGPGRARRWRAEHPIEGAIYAETIPFSETRDYVKKVMSNAVYYAALFEERPQSLKSRLGVVRPKGYGDTTAEELP